MQDDPLLHYAQALDRGDMNAIGVIWKERNKELELAINSLHARFDSHESFTAQLMRLRQSLEGGTSEGSAPNRMG